MKFSLMEIRGLVHPLRKLAGQDLSIKTSWKLLQLSETVEELNQKIEEFRVNLVKKYGEKVFDVTLEDGEHKLLNEAEYESADKTLFTNVQAKLDIINPENLHTFMQEFNELLLTEEELEVSTLSLDDLGDNVTITPQELYCLKKIFVE